jgi:hypothetical protein
LQQNYKPATHAGSNNSWEPVFALARRTKKRKEAVISNKLSFQRSCHFKEAVISKKQCHFKGKYNKFM